MIKKSNEYTLKQAIEEMMNTYRLQGKIDEVKLLNSWEKVMGPAIAKYTQKIYIQNRVLYLELSSAPLREELSYAKTKMIRLLNDEAGGSVIDDIVLR